MVPRNFLNVFRMWGGGILLNGIVHEHFVTYLNRDASEAQKVSRTWAKHWAGHQISRQDKRLKAGHLGRTF